MLRLIPLARGVAAVAFRKSLCPHFRVTASEATLLARSGDLLAAAGLPRSARASHDWLHAPVIAVVMGCFRQSDGCCRLTPGAGSFILQRRSLVMMFAVALTATASVGTATAQLPTSAADEPCNPVIDGTYCATQGGRLSNSGSSISMAPIQSLSGDLSLGQSNPGTFAGITLSGNNTICIGFLRRASCN
ncbi:MAG TPA: hypothetical protein VGG11_20265 [Xanthobacteraceae bacterium]|jgi:hypothetical protein